jgi:tape measure domain-containing protein
MATEVERLVVSLDASITKYERAMQRALGQTNTTARKIERRFDDLGGRIDGAFGRAFAVIGGAASLRGFQQLIDTSTRLQNSLKISGLAGEDLTRVYGDLFASAQRNAAPLESLVTLYGRAAIVQKELGVSTEELLGFTDNVALALRVAGTDAQTASGALLQLSQALGAGTVRAEEFNSILEGALPIAQAAAAGLDEAGGSVAKLRALVVDGKVSSEAFFRAFEAGSVILTDKVANAELTVSQAFVRLQNVLIDVAGKFNEGTGASRSFVQSLDLLGRAVEDAANSEKVDQFLTALNEFGNAQIAGTVREFEALGSAVDAVSSAFDRYGPSVSDAELATAQAEQALVNLALNTKGTFGEVDAAFQDLVQQLLGGKGTAESTAAAIEALGEANPDFSALQNKIAGVIQNFLALRQAAAAATQLDDVGAFPSQAEFAGQFKPPTPVKPVSITDYGTPAGSGGSGKGGGGQSPAERFNESLEQQRQRLAELNREIDLREQLGLAFDENGLAMEKLRVQMELENEASRAGLELTPARKDAIDQLASAYAEASVELDDLTQSQELAKAAMENFADAAETGIRGFIDDLIEGKSATEALGNALASVGNALLDFGLSSLTSMFTPGGAGLAALFPGKEFGGSVRAGQPYIVGEKRPELFIPNQSGTIIPRLPTMPSASAASASVTFAPVIDARGADAASVARLERNMVKMASEMEGQVKQIVRTQGRKWK